MGQYYKPFLLDKQTSKPIGCFISWDYDNGAKLTEHSYMENNFVNAVANYIIKLKGARLVWAGDYADKVENLDKEIFDVCVESLKKGYCADNPKEMEEVISAGFNYYEIAAALTETNPDFNIHYNNCKNVVDRGYRFLVNETKKEFVDLWNIPCVSQGYDINPLPILTAGYNANGQGGGDYDGLSLDFVGRWCGDVINYKKRGKTYLDKPKGYTEIKPDFVSTYALVDQFNECVKFLERACCETHESYNFEKNKYETTTLLSNFSGKDKKFMLAIESLKEIQKKLNK